MLVYLDAYDSCSPEHQRLLSAFTHLKDVKLRQQWEPEHGIFIAESRNVIERALEVGCQPQAFLMTQRWLKPLLPILHAATGAPDGGQIPVFILPEDQVETITGYHVHRGALAAMQRPSLLRAEDVLVGVSTGPRPSVAILEGLVDHTNVGAIFRSAAALGIGGILLSPTCADPLYRRSIRVSMGAVFQIPWARIERWPDFTILRQHGFEVCALTPNPRSASLEEHVASLIANDRDHGLALLLGSEGPGLSAQSMEQADVRVAIPLAPHIDSLNVGTAAAIAFWEARRYTCAS